MWQGNDNAYGYPPTVGLAVSAIMRSLLEIITSSLGLRYKLL